MQYDRALSRSIKRLIADVGTFLEGQRDQIDAIAEHAKSSNKPAEPSPPKPLEGVCNEVSLPPGVIERYYTEQRKTYNLQLCMFLVSILTLVVLAVYTDYTQKMSSANKEAADAAKTSADAAVAANRAWIVPANEAQQMNTAVPINLEWKNAGPTPAVQVSGTAEYALDSPSKDKKSCEQLRSSNRWKTQTSMILTNMGFMMTLTNVPPRWEQPMHSDALILFIHGCVWYTDVVTNRERTTEFCYIADRTNRDAVYSRRPDLKGHLPEATVSPCLHTDPFIFK